jgi:hypothetical protein
LGEEVDDDLQGVKVVIKKRIKVKRQKDDKQVIKILLGAPLLHANFPKPTRRLGRGHGGRKDISASLL